MEILKDLLYSEDHEWVKVDGDEALIGITDYAQHELGDIVFVDMPEEDDSFEKGDAFGAIESVKAASDALMPVGGTVIEINEELEDEPEMLNEKPYEAWIIRIKLEDESELDGLMDADEYERYTESL
jgi:glycine cleavage system H protein